jgi:hypothetical protein
LCGDVGGEPNDEDVGDVDSLLRRRGRVAHGNLR